MAGRRIAVLLAVVTACALVPVPHAAAAPLPGAWCGPDESPRDRPDFIAGKQVHVVYAYPTDGVNRFGDMVRAIVRDLAGIDTWWRSQDPLRTPRFDLAVFPGCDTEFGTVDVSSVPLTFDSGVYDSEGTGDFAFLVGNDLMANGLSHTDKKYLVYYDGPASGGICGRSASSSASGGPRRLTFVYLQGDAGCRVGGFGTGDGWPARSAAHELLHAFNDTFAPDTAPNACEDRGHVCDSTADILSTGSSHPSARLFDATLDVGHDDYYDHTGSWWDIRDSGWLVHLESPPGLLTVAIAGTGGKVTSIPDGSLCSDLCTKRYDGGTAVRLVAIEHNGYRLVSWGGACSGNSRTCDIAVESAGAAVTATFGRAVTVTARTLGPGHIRQLDGAPCTGDCALDLIPGSLVVLGAEPAPDAQFVGWRGLCTGSRQTCTVAVSLGAVRPSLTAVFRDVSRSAA